MYMGQRRIHLYSVIWRLSFSIPGHVVHEAENPCQNCKTKNQFGGCQNANRLHARANFVLRQNTHFTISCLPLCVSYIHRRPCVLDGSFAFVPIYGWLWLWKRVCVCVLCCCCGEIFVATESAREQASKHKRENVTTRNSGESFFAHYGVSYARRYSIFTRTKKKKRICDERIFNCSLSHPSAPLVEPANFFFWFLFYTLGIFRSVFACAKCKWVSLISHISQQTKATAAAVLDENPYKGKQWISLRMDIQVN